MYKISVIVPIYNVEDFLEQSLDSLYSQTISDLQVILVNDGSIDRSEEICFAYKSTHPDTIVINQKNQGLSAARNAGTAIATGEYLFYLDSDDWLTPNALENLYEFAKKNDCEIVQGGYYYAYEDYLLNIFAKSTPEILSRQEAMSELINDRKIKNFAWGKLYKKEIVENHQFPVGKYFEDSYWQHITIDQCEHFGILPTPMYYYRQRTTSISGAFTVKIVDLLKGYEIRLPFVQEKYPEQIHEIVQKFWETGYSVQMSAQKSEDSMLRNTINAYWTEINIKYEGLFQKELADYLRYCLWQKHPSILPVYDWVYKIKEKISNVSDKIWKNEKVKI